MAISNVPHVSRTTAFLDAKHMVQNPVEVFERYRASLGPTFTFHFGGAKRAVVSTEPEFLQHVLKTHHGNYVKSHIQTKHMVEFQGVGLVNSHGEEWLRRRKLVARGFTPSRMASMLPLQIEVLDGLMARFEADAAAGPVDVYEHMVRFTLGMVGRSIFGRAATDAELQQIADAISEIQAYIVEMIVQPYLIPWFRITGKARRYQRIRREADAVVLRHIEARRATSSVGYDFLKLLLEEPFHDTQSPMEEGQALVEALQLMVAGNETSSIAATWLLYLLAIHPEHAARIQAEVDAHVGQGPITAASLKELEHTVRCLHEALRLYPPFWMIDRIALQDDEAAGVKIPKGAMVIPYIYGTHRNTALWDDPERFDPDRFLKPAVQARHPFAHVPFGGGPRLCVGNSMAISQITLIVATLLRRYDLRYERDEPVRTRPMMLLRPDGDVPVRFVPRA
ncbi:MAG: cytochrome P450 [Planctomycetes bacterium]|nr:cytochrome P450 [Planctomycetota bacterium]